MKTLLPDRIACSEFVRMLVRVNGGQFLGRRAATDYVSFVGEP